MAIKLIALLDGTIVDPATPILRADDQGVVRGDGVFDATLAERGVARDLDAHLERLAQSAAMLQLPVPDDAGFRRAIDAILEAWDWEAEPEAVLRMIHTRGPEGVGEPSGWVMAGAIDEETRGQRKTGAKILILDRGFEGSEVAPLPWLLPGAKSLSYGINMAAKRWGAAHGADDIVFRSPSGKLLEGPTCSIVLDLDGVLVTPPLDGILRSITVEVLLAKAAEHGLTVEMREITVDDLARCNGAWLLSSGRLATHVTHVDGRELPVSPLKAQVAAALDVPQD